MTDHATPIQDRELPPELAAQFRTALRLDEPPATIGDWVAATRRVLGDGGPAVDPDDLCLTDSSRHEARTDDGVRHYRCVLDALLVPFLRDGPAAAEIRSRSPVSDTVVEIDVANGEIESVTPETAVVSLGIADDVRPPEETGESLPEYGYERFCPYVDAFADESEYEAWAAETPGAVTTALPAADAVTLARLLGGE